MEEFKCTLHKFRVLKRLELKFVRDAILFNREVLSLLLCSNPFINIIFLVVGLLWIASKYNGITSILHIMTRSFQTV